MGFQITAYNDSMERDWVRCRLLSFLDTSYYDDVVRAKPVYQNQAIQLVALDSRDTLVGLIDIELEGIAGTFCNNKVIRSGMIHHIAVHPDFRKGGVGSALLLEAEVQSIRNQITRLEAWTRDDSWVRDWYRKQAFSEFYSYLHVFMNKKDISNPSEIQDLKMITGFAHYTGLNRTEIYSRFERVHECMGFEKLLAL